MNAPTSTPLEVVLTLPPAPLVLATSGFLVTLASVEAEIASLAVTDTISAQVCANLQTRLTSAGSALERQRKLLKDPFIAAGRAIDDAARGPSDRIENAKNAVKAKLGAYDAAERKKAADAEAKRQDELRKLREQQEREASEARKRQQEAEAEAARLATASEVPVMDLGDDTPVAPTATEIAIAALEQAPAVVAPKPAGVSMRVLLVATVVDVEKLPAQFVEKTAKIAAIRATYCSGWKEGNALPECPGVKFEISRTPISTGRPVF